MSGYTPADLTRARRPIADASERGEAVCTLGHLQVEQRESPTAERAAIIAEVEGHIASFDGAPALITASPPLPAASVPAPLTRLPTPTKTAHDPLPAGIAMAQASMERALRSQGIMPVGKSTSGARASVATSSMERTLRQMGMTPRAGG